MLRDRETDSWWSIMTSTAIGGTLNGADLVELPLGEKTTWREWRQRYPDSLVLSVDGSEHERTNPYQDYFDSEKTFRGLEIEDRRLAPKAPIFSFWWRGKPYAVAHESIEGGRILQPEDFGGRWLLLHRRRGASLFESTRAFVLDAEAGGEAADPEVVLKGIDGDGIEAERLPGFDTFWYNWIAVNRESSLLP